MPRGHYGALNRDAHFVAAWAEDAAVKRAIDSAAPAIGVAGSIKRGYDGTRKVISGAQLVRANRRHAVGQDWFHSVKDRQRALDSITAGLTQIATEIVQWHDQHPEQMQRESSVQWVESDVLPTVREWNEFASRERASWLVRAATSWGTFVHWQERVRNLRQLARAHGIVLETPELEPLPKTIWEESDNGTGNQVSSWLGIGKLVFGAAVTIAGAATVISVVRSLRKQIPAILPVAPPATPETAPAITSPSSTAPTPSEA